MSNYPVVKNQRVEIWISVVFLALGFFFLWDAADNHGTQPPLLLRWLTFW